MTDGEHPRVEAVQATVRHPALDGPSAKPQFHQLPIRDYAVLPFREFPHRQIAWAASSMNSVFEIAHARTVAGKGAQVCGV